IVLRRFDGGKCVSQLGGGFAEDDRSRNFGIEATWPVNFDQQGEVVASLKRPALHVARNEGRPGPERGGAAEENALFAAEHLALALGDRGDVDVSQPRTYLLQNFGEDFVLQPGSSPNQRDFLVAFDRLDGVDIRGNVDE